MEPKVETDSNTSNKIATNNTLLKTYNKADWINIQYEDHLELEIDRHELHFLDAYQTIAIQNIVLAAVSPGETITAIDLSEQDQAIAQVIELIKTITPNVFNDFDETNTDLSKTDLAIKNLQECLVSKPNFRKTLEQQLGRQQYYAF